MSGRTRAAEVLKRLPDGDLTGAEIGIFQGRMSLALLKNPHLILFMVDNWKAMPRYRISEEDQKANHRMARQNAVDRGIILHMDSWEAARKVPDKCLDFVFIDADHSYEGVSSDISLWKPKLKATGLLCGHDYANPNEPCGMEVKRAVDEAAVKYGFTVELGRDSCWFAR